MTRPCTCLHWSACCLLLPAPPSHLPLQVDTTALLSLLVYHGASCFLPPFASCRPSVLPALTVLIPLLLLLLLNHSHSWYIKHR